MKGNNRYKCKVSVDGTDFRIFEPTPFNSKWYSHKFKGPGLRYEVGVCIVTGHVVWVNGPFPCGKYSDVKIFRLAMKRALLNGESVIADGGYTDERCEKNRQSRVVPKHLHSLARARHETVNRRFKQFSVLGTRFRHDKSLHSVCFHAVANLTQLMLSHGEPLFSN